MNKSNVKATFNTEEAFLKIINRMKKTKPCIESDRNEMSEPQQAIKCEFIHSFAKLNLIFFFFFKFGTSKCERLIAFCVI